jgi:S1-C subfamily serine protease
MTDNSATPSETGGFCPSCGSPNQASGPYCTDCGAPLTGSSNGSTNRVAAWATVAVAAAFTLIAVTIALLAFAGGGENTAISPDTTTTMPIATTTRAPSPSTTVAIVDGFGDKDLADLFGDAVFKIMTDGCDIQGIGSGFAVDANHIVTNRHVVDNDTTPRIVGRDGSVYDGRVVGWRENPDMAVIWVDAELDPYLEVGGF